jgi:hypothetical protein
LTRVRATLVLAALLGGLGLASACRSTNPCKAGTLLVDVTLDATTSAADGIDVAVVIAGGGANQPSTVPHQAGATSGTIEIDFPGGYPTAQSVQVTLTARKSGKAIGMASATVSSLASGCQTLPIELTGLTGGGGQGGHAGAPGAGGHTTATGGSTGTGGAAGAGGHPGAGAGGKAGATAGAGGHGGAGGVAGAAGQGGGGQGGAAGAGGAAAGGAAGAAGSGGAAGSAPTTCIEGLTIPPPSTRLTDFAGYYSYPSAAGTLTQSGGGFTFTANLDAPSADVPYPLAGFALMFEGTACIDASTYTGVSFTLNVDPSTTCALHFQFDYAEVDPPKYRPDQGLCDSTVFGCYPPAFYFTGFTSGTAMVSFAKEPDNPGSPAVPVDDQKLTGVHWEFDTPNPPAACTGTMTISNVVFYR